MSNKPLKTNMQKKWQQGVALLFALGILSLLLVMALGFATNSIFDQMIASNNSSTSSARVIADSGLERVRTMLQYYSDNMSRLTAGNYLNDGILGYSHSLDTSVFSADDARSEMLSDLRFFGNYPTSGWTADMSTNINWIYLKSGNRIIGRMAYLILNRADLDPAKLVKLKVNESASPAPEVRVGAEANEINIGSVSTLLTTAMLKQFNYSNALYVASFAGAFEGNWIDYQFMFKQFGTITGFDDTMKNNFQNWFICNSKNSPEAFWIDRDANSKITMVRSATALYSEEQIHRFNIARDWYNDFPGSVELYDKVLLSTAASGTLPNVNIFKLPPAGSIWTDENFDGYGIPWLATFGMKKKTTSPLTTTINGITYDIWEDDDTDAAMTGSFATVAARRHQVAANLVDYCKPVTVSATSDQPNWLTDAPKFTGNKKTPYIDEIGVALEAAATYSCTETSVPKDTLTVTVVLNGFLLGKLIDIYSTTSWTKTFALKVRGNINYGVTVNGEDLISSVGPYSFEYNLPSTSFNWNAGYGTCLFPFNAVTLADSSKTTLTYTKTNSTAWVSPYPATVVNNVSVQITSAVLYSETPATFYDYSTINKSATNSGKLLDCTDDASTDQLASVYFSFQTEDPRQNLNVGDWYVPGTTPKKDYSTVNSGSGVDCWAVNFIGIAYSGIANYQSDPAAAHIAAPTNTDAETVTDPAGGTLSTAFIREAPMVSPWELGFIHRGVKWQTLNLHKYDPNKKALAIAVDDGSDNIFSAGGGTYANGDANILDQIKMNTYPKNYKVDLRNKYQDVGGNVVMNALLTNILSGSTLNATGINGGAAILPADIASISNAITPNVYFTRAQLINDIALVTPISVCTTKASQDEIIGKFINLVDFDSYYTVILAVQTIKDVGGNGSDIPINKKLPGDTTSTTIPARLGTFDKVISSGKNYYADEITSTLMVQALIHKKTDGSCEILSVNYIY